MGIGAILGLLASLVGTGISVGMKKKQEKKQEATAEEERKLREKLALKEAMARSLGVKDSPYINPNLKMPGAADTTIPDTAAAVGGAVSNAASSNWAQQMYPSK